MNLIEWLKIIGGFFVYPVPFAAWVTHIIVCLLKAQYLLLIAGAFVFPVGTI